MKIKLKLSVPDNKKSMEVTPDELGYTDEGWKQMDDDEKYSLLISFIDKIEEQPYWYLESFKTL